ncbi:MAG TPA: signal peptide peptidase SppA [Gammaproteobacteria bacterium]|nr:signal peptide peptidase SppA [Gammaproteobacteria bacterium]
MSKDNPNWERETITELAWEGLREKRRARRWSIFFKLLMFLYLIAVLFAFSDWPKTDALPGKSHTALIKVKGIIADGADASAEQINALLRKAFSSHNTKGVVLEINSPGGAPVQAASIYQEIRRLRKKHKDIPLYAVVSDLCASGGYYVAAAADKIYAAKASIVGSIGVRMDSFGVTRLADKLGIESRTITAGENKALLDPFRPENPEQRAHLQNMLDQVHQLFISDVKAGRGDRLKTDAPGLFSGLIWTGEEAKRLGLIDDFGDTDFVAREVIGEKTVVEYEGKKDLLEQLTSDFGGVAGEMMKKFSAALFDKTPLPR